MESASQGAVVKGWCDVVLGGVGRGVLPARVGRVRWREVIVGGVVGGWPGGPSRLYLASIGFGPDISQSSLVRRAGLLMLSHEVVLKAGSSSARPDRRPSCSLSDHLLGCTVAGGDGGVPGLAACHDGVELA